LDRIDLAGDGVAVYYCRLWVDDYLWFASSDISAVSTTEGVIHNYALAYALNRYDRAFVDQEAPTYEEDLARMDIYPTPARAAVINRTSLTFNAIDSVTQQTESPGLGKRLTPKIGVRRVINPTLTRQRAFEFYAFVRDAAVLPRVIRIGKKRSPGHLKTRLLEQPLATLVDGDVVLGHVLNPLDTDADLVQYSVISIPPHLLLAEATVRQAWVLRDGQQAVLVPDHVLDWVRSRDES